MPNYDHVERNTDPNFASGGYKNVMFFAPRTSFDVLSPVMANPLALGDALTIGAAHTFTAPAGFFEHVCKRHSVTLTGATVGEDDAKEMEWTGKWTILGDSAGLQEQLQRQLNDDLIVLLKDSSCVGNQYIQLGDDCISPEFTVSYDGKTTKEGKHEYTVEVKCKKKYWYNYAVTKAA